MQSQQRLVGQRGARLSSRRKASKARKFSSCTASQASTEKRRKKIAKLFG
jgi:hypothetical protein